MIRLTSYETLKPDWKDFICHQSWFGSRERFSWNSSHHQCFPLLCLILTWHLELNFIFNNIKSGAQTEQPPRQRISINMKMIILLLFLHKFCLLLLLWTLIGALNWIKRYFYFENWFAWLNRNLFIETRINSIQYARFNVARHQMTISLILSTEKWLERQQIEGIMNYPRAERKRKIFIFYCYANLMFQPKILPCSARLNSHFSSHQCGELQSIPLRVNILFPIRHLKYCVH